MANGAFNAASLHPQADFINWSNEYVRRNLNSSGSVHIAKDTCIMPIHTIATPPTESTRELITYSQMVTYGYCAATTVENGKAVTQAVKVGNPGRIFSGSRNIQVAANENRITGINIEPFASARNISGGAFNGIPSNTSTTTFASKGNAWDGVGVMAAVDSSTAFTGGSTVISPGIITNSGSHRDYDRYGNFHKGGTFYRGLFDGEIFGASEASRIDVKSWLDAGLRRDLNVFVKPDQASRKVFDHCAILVNSIANFDPDVDSALRRGILLEVWNGGLDCKDSELSNINKPSPATKRTIQDMPVGRKYGLLYRIYFYDSTGTHNVGTERWRTVDVADNPSGLLDYTADFSFGIDVATYNTQILITSRVIYAINTMGKTIGAGNTGVFGRPWFNAAPHSSNNVFALSASADFQAPEFDMILYPGMGNASGSFIPYTEGGATRSSFAAAAVYRDTELNFTILTASSPNYGAAANGGGRSWFGSGSAGARLSCNIYRRNLLSTGSFRIFAPVRKASKSVRTSPTYLSSFDDSQEPTNSAIAVRREHAGFIGVPYTPGSRKDDMPGGRNYTRGASADKTFTNYAATAVFMGAHAFDPGMLRSGIPSAGKGADDFTDFALPKFYTGLSGSDGTKVSDESLYVLLPEDKLVLGVQPAQGGGNPGYPQSLNPNLTPYNPFGEQAPTANWGHTLVDMKMNVESAYEQAHSLTMKRGQGRLVLYGTLLRDQKHHPTNLNQDLVSNEIHQVVGQEPILDQFLVGSVGEYRGCYLENLITGSVGLFNKKIMESQVQRMMANPGVFKSKRRSWQRYLRAAWKSAVAEARGIKRSASGISEGAEATTGLLSISGSFNRFVSLSDQSEVYYDSLLPNVGEIFEKYGRKPCQHAKFTYFTTPYAPPIFNVGPEALADSFYTALPSPYREDINTMAGWQHSFPFEAKWRSENPTRITEPRGGLGAEISQASTTTQVRFATGDTWTTIGGGGFSRRREQGINSGGSTATFEFPMTTWTMTVQMAETSNGTLKIGPGGAAPSGGQGFVQAAEIFQSSTQQNDLTAIRLAGFWDGEFSVSGSATVLCNYFFAKGTGPVTHGNTSFAGLTHPSGWRYGLMNFRPTAPNCIFRPDRYGQLRDMFEQRKYTKFYDRGSSFDIEGLTDSAVSCIFLDADGRPVEDPLETSCYNVSNTMTSSRPYIDGSTEERIITSRFVSIDI